MDFSEARLWVEVPVAVLTAVNSLVLWLRKPGEDAKRSAQEALDRITAVEQRIAHMPNDEELATLRGSVQEVKAVVEGQRDLLKRVERQQTLILEQLLTHPK